MNLLGSGYNLSGDYQRDEQLARQFPHGGRLPDSPNRESRDDWRCVLPCPNPQCPYIGLLLTGEFKFGQPGWDCSTFTAAVMDSVDKPAPVTV